MMFGQEPPDVGGRQRIFGAQGFEVLLTLGRRQVEQSIEMRARTLPAVGADRTHVLPARSVDRKREPKPDITPAMRRFGAPGAGKFAPSASRAEPFAPRRPSSR